MIDHQANHHSELERDEYLNILSILDNYDDIKDLSDGGQLKLAFIKKIGKSYAVVVELSKEDGKILLHKSFFYRDKTGKRIPYKNKPSIFEKWSVDGSTTISPAEKQPADTDNISVLDHGAKLGNSSESSDKKSEKVGETHEEKGDKRIVSDKDFNVDDIDFEHNYVVIHQTMSRVFDSILRDGLHTAGGLIGTSVFGNRENIEDTLKAEREGHGHKGSNGLVIMQFPKSWFNGRRIDLDDISMELSDRFGPDAFLTVPPQFITHTVVAGKMEEDGASDKASPHLVDPREMSDKEKEQRGICFLLQKPSL